MIYAEKKKSKARVGLETFLKLSRLAAIIRFLGTDGGVKDHSTPPCNKVGRGKTPGYPCANCHCVRYTPCHCMRKAIAV